MDQTAIARSANFLVFDDDPLVATLTSFLLEDLGHHAIEPDSGARALEILMKGQTVDLVITDYSMPKMTGLELANAIHEIRLDLFILLATGYADLPAAFNSNIPRRRKPYRPDELVVEIAKTLAV